MTSELARGGPTLADMELASVERIRRLRLDRLREGRGDAPRATPAAPPPRPSAERVAALARDTGGTVVATSRSPVVLVESCTLLPPAFEGLAALPEPVAADARLLLLDTETTGLGTGTGTVPFMVGLGAWQGSDLVIRQLVLPEQSDEAGFLEALDSLIPPDAWLVTYNGRTFDWPLLVARYRLQGRPAPPHRSHLDLLPLARTIWRERLSDARLATVERAVCGVQRSHDLPGGLVPARYLDYLRSGHAGLLRVVLEHNRQDVLSMALLLRVLAQDLAPASWRGGVPPSVAAGDLGGLGRAYARRRRHDEALACLDVAMERLVDRRDAQHHESIAIERARVLTRLGRRAEAEGAWQAIALEGGRQAAYAWLHVAKHREHDGRDPVAALRATDRARALAERSRLFGRRDQVVERDLPRRVARLRRRVAAVPA